MKKTLFILIAILIGTSMAFSQYVPGTLPVPGGNATRGVAANGLTSLYSISGNYTLSVDGAGLASGSSYSINVNKPSGATVHAAYLMGVTYDGGLADNCITLAGTSIVWDGSLGNTLGGTNTQADVTAIVAPIIDGSTAGINSLVVTECSSLIDGVALLVIFDDPSAFTKTIVIMFGAASAAGDNFSLTLGTPIDPIAPGALLDMGIGISFGYQIGSGGQHSVIDINGVRLTTAAGGQDDGINHASNGELITVGGLGDSNGNPADPYAYATNWDSDDELYSLLPLITNTTTNILVNTVNPSDDDNIFLSYFEISGVAIIGEGIILSQVQNVENLGDQHTVDALVQDDLGDPIAGKQVDFTVLSGPNAGNMFSGTTDANGDVSYTYTGTGGAGFDNIQACFIDSQSNQKCSNTVIVEWTGNGPPPSVPLSDWAIYLGILLIATFMFVRFKR